MGTGHEGARILVIDDESVMQRLFQNILRHAGYEVVIAKTGLEGIQLAQHDVPRLIILDYVMPDMDGMETLKELKGNDRTRGIPVLMATGYLDANTSQQFAAAGAARCISKPFEAQALTAVVEKLLTDETGTGASNPPLEDKANAAGGASQEP